MMDRRTIIAVAAVLPITSAVALAQPDDPVLAAYARWKVMRGEYEAVVKEWAAVVSPG